ncbi:MAG: hypothetical protein Ta2G_05210 [Termitinemataceae bacterium]|nr:MAG: hypothetical protein Ta2G_05210 [Termitinemataceae bacterium]
MRIEVIANHSVEENIFDEFTVEGVCKHYTKLNNQHGVGTSGPRMGDAVWPEENFILTVWCEEEEALGIERALKRVKARFPGEGIKMFGLHEVSSNTALLEGRITNLLEYKPQDGGKAFKSSKRTSRKKSSSVENTEEAEGRMDAQNETDNETAAKLTTALGIKV